MKPMLPQCCAPQAYELLARQVPVIESADALLQGAVAIAMHQNPDADCAKIDAYLQNLADTIRKRVRGPQPQAMLAHLHAFLFEELGLIGNKENYYNANNSYLPAVLKSRKGLPITLSLVYKLVGMRLGLRVHGIGLPGHFMCAVEMDGGMMLVDPFAGGRVLSPDEAHELVQERFGPEVEWSDDMLEPVTNLHWLTRMLQNLLHVFGGAGQYADVAAMLELEMALWPAQTHLQRDLALVLARIGLSRPASMWLDKYLKDNPNDPQKSDLRQLLEVLTT
ncbi:MAG TPA: transglutaminase-like domain-containing protein [Tepidisphaeraceae bacterium]|nr:transglutaminase-like domain-containing protein [Tepidisphaeraceae bacterium]